MLADSKVMELDGQPASPDVVQALGLTNYGHFTSMRVEDGRVRGLSLHLERLVRDCRALFAADLDPDRVRRLVADAVRGRSGAFVVRVTVFDPSLDLGHPGATLTPRIGITFRPAAAAALPPLRLGSRQYRRDLPAVKHVGLFGPLRERRAAQLAGYDDALLVSREQVLEGPTWNIGLYDGQSFVWPDGEVLPGVTMTLLQQRQPHKTVPVYVDALDAFQAAFATNTSIGIRPIRAIDKVEFQVDHPIYEVLRAAYAAVQLDSLG